MDIDARYCRCVAATASTLGQSMAESLCAKSVYESRGWQARQPACDRRRRTSTQRRRRTRSKTEKQKSKQKQQH